MGREHISCRNNSFQAFPAVKNLSGRHQAASRRQRLHMRIKVGLAFKANARQIRQGHMAVYHLDAVRETAKGLKQVGVGLIAAQSQACSDVQRHLVAAVRNAAAG